MNQVGGELGQRALRVTRWGGEGRGAGGGGGVGGRAVRAQPLGEEVLQSPLGPWSQ